MEIINAAGTAKVVGPMESKKELWLDFQELEAVVMALGDTVEQLNEMQEQAAKRDPDYCDPYLLILNSSLRKAQLLLEHWKKAKAAGEAWEKYMRVCNGLPEDNPLPPSGDLPF